MLCFWNTTQKWDCGGEVRVLPQEMCGWTWLDMGKVIPGVDVGKRE